MATLNKEQQAFVEKEKAESKGYTYRAKVLKGQHIILKEKNNTPVKKWNVLYEFNIVRLMVEKLNENKSLSGVKKGGSKKGKNQALKEYEIYKNGTQQGTVMAKNLKDAERQVFAFYGEHREVALSGVKKGTKDKVYIDFLNKEKGFQKDRKYFKSYEEAQKWAKSNFERFDPDIIHFTDYQYRDSVSGVKKGGSVESKMLKANINLHENILTYKYPKTVDGITRAMQGDKFSQAVINFKGIKSRIHGFLTEIEEASFDKANSIGTIILKYKSLSGVKKGKCSKASGHKGCISKIGSKWRIRSNKTGEFWPAKYRTKALAQAGLKAYYVKQSISGIFKSTKELINVSLHNTADGISRIFAVFDIDPPTKALKLIQVATGKTINEAASKARNSKYGSFIKSWEQSHSSIDKIKPSLWGLSGKFIIKYGTDHWCYAILTFLGFLTTSDKNAAKVFKSKAECEYFINRLAPDQKKKCVIVEIT